MTPVGSGVSVGYDDRSSCPKDYLAEAQNKIEALRGAMMKSKSVGPMISAIIILIFGLYSFLKGLTFFSWISWLQLYYRIAQILILLSGFVYIITSIFLFRFKGWAKNLLLVWSIVLVLYFIPLSIVLVFDPSGWGSVMVFSFAPYILFPLLFIIFLTRPRVKELFNK
ncbi:MAG: hypothetical protein V1925_01400 [Candidatus Omnitrophota bacterium]